MAVKVVIICGTLGDVLNNINHQDGKTPNQVVLLFEGFTPSTIAVTDTIVEAIKKLDIAVGALPGGPPSTISGSRGGNPALGQLLADMDSKGYIIDATTP